MTVSGYAVSLEIIGCLGLFGHNINSIYKAIIQYIIKPQIIFLMLDPDVNQEEIEIGKDLSLSTGILVCVCQLKEHDPDELCQSELLDSLLLSNNVNQYDILSNKLIIKASH